MKETRRNLLVGVFVLCGLLSLGALVVLFGKAPGWLVRGDAYPLHIRFEQVADIRPGNLVTVRGITIGRVQSVDLVDRTDFDAGVDVVVSVQRGYQIPTGSRAQTTEPVLGQGRPPIEIIPGPTPQRPYSEGDWLVEGATITGTVRTAIDSIFPTGVVSTFQTTARQIGDAAEAMTPVLDELRELVSRREPRLVDQPGGPSGNLSSVVARFDSSLRHFNEVLGDVEVKSQLRETVANLHAMSERGTRAMEDIEAAAEDTRALVTDGRRFTARAEEVLGSVESEFRDLSQHTLGTLDKMDTVLGHLDAVGQQVRSGEGTIGKLVMDNDLYEALVISTQRLALAIDDLRALIAEWREGKIKVAL